MTLHLQVLVGPSRGRVFSLDGGPFRAGRSEDCDVVIASDFVSREHASLTAVGAELRVADLGSSNGTFLGAARIHGEWAAAPGDVVLVGDTALRVSAELPPDLRMDAPPSSLAELPPAALLRYVAVVKRTVVVSMTSPPLVGKVVFSRGHIREVSVGGRPSRDPIQALTAIMRWRGTFEFEPPVGEEELHRGAALLGLDAVVPGVGTLARASRPPTGPAR